MKRSSQRAKGKKGEYDVRNYFRENGFVSHRVPSSGSAHGFPGDVLVKHPNGTKFLIEVKVRKDEFKNIYKLIENDHTEVIRHIYNGKQVTVAKDFFSMFSQQHKSTVNYDLYELAHFGELLKVVKKLDKMHEWIKGSDYLVVRMDRKPFLFIRYTLLPEKK